MKVVVDTNVAIVANGRDTHANLACQLRCLQRLEKVASAINNEIVVLDSDGLMIEEYRRYLNFRGQPGVGDVFFKYLHDHMYGGERVQLVDITKNDDDDTGFDELPVNAIDKSDRKFLAAAMVSDAHVINATDTDWHEQKAMIDLLAVNVEQLCPEHGCVVP